MSMAKTKWVCLLLSRLLAFSATLSAAIIMATSHQKTTFFSLSFEAKFTHTQSFKYYLIVNIIISVYGLLVLLLPPSSALWQLVICTDTIATVLLSSCVSAALAVAQVGKKGNSYAGWLPICGQVSKYCDQVTVALIAGFIALVIYLLFQLYALHNLLRPLLLQKT